MANRRVEEQLEQLSALRVMPRDEAALAAIRKALRDRVNVVVAKAASIAAEWQAHMIIPNLVAAYDQLFINAVKTDPQCAGKNAIAKSLKELGWNEISIFERGLSHVQLEPTWGGTEDSASGLRGTCALALCQCTDRPRHDILLLLVNALTDSHSAVRVEAARALEQIGGKESSLLLRLKARVGDKEPRVTGQVLECVLALEGAGAVEFVKTFLEHSNAETRDEAALALGTSRLPAAIEALQMAWLKTGVSRDGACLIRAISASRQDSAIEFIFDQIKSARLMVAEECLWALQLHRESPEIVGQIQKCVESRSELKDSFAKIFRQ